MTIQTIQYQNKVALNTNPEIADINKVTDNDMNEIKSVVNNNANNIGDLTDLETSDKTSVVNAINSKVIKKLWENQNPTNNFNPQTISFNAAGYDYFIILFKNTASSTIYDSKIAFKNIRFSLNGINAGKIFARNTDTNGINDTGVTFQNGLFIDNYGAETVSNQYAVPYQIYGGKF